MSKREEQKQLAIELFNRVESCTTEEDLEKASDMAEEAVQAGRINKKAFRWIEETLDDRLSYLVERGIV